MKKLLLLMILGSTTMLLFAQKETPQPSSSLPESVRSSFNRSHPNATVNGWYKENKNYKVIFREPPALQQLIVYDKEGNVLRTETELHSIDYPSTIVEYYKKNYPGEKDYMIWVSKDEKGVTTYYSPIHDMTIYFDKDGKFIRQEKRLPNEVIK